MDSPEHEEDYGALPDVEEGPVRWEESVDIAGNPCMRPEMPKPEPGAFVLQAAQVPLGVTIRPNPYAPNFFRYTQF